MIFGYSLGQIIVRLIAVLLAMSFHEMAHALVAYWMGDRTAKRAGRLSFNPLDHIDWVGLLCLLFFGFGWARPVPIDPRNMKDEKAGIIWTSFAGPLANFLLSFVFLLLAVILLKTVPGFVMQSVGQFIFNVIITTAQLSLGFGIFNLIPIPPLDGAKIFWAFLPDRTYYKWMNGTPWMSLVLILLIYSGLLSAPMNMLLNTIYSGMLNICQTLTAFL